MGVPLNAGVAASGVSPYSGDQANAVISGSFTAVGPSLPFAFWGPANLVIYASINTALTTTNGSNSCSVASGTGLSPGDAINSKNVPAGTTLATLSGTSGTLALPSNQDTSSVVTGTDDAAIFTGSGITYSGSVQLERSFDGGATWVVCGIGGAGNLAIWATGTPVSAAFGEPERNVAYRLNCTAYTSGTINYRISMTGAAALSMSVNSAL